MSPNQGSTARSRSRHSRWLDIDPVLHWLDHDVLPRYGSLNRLAAALAERTDIQPKSWRRQLKRLHSRSRIDFFTLDRLCCLLGEHVSRFCDPAAFCFETAEPAAQHGDQL